MNWKKWSRRVASWAGYGGAIASVVGDTVPGVVGVVAGVVGGYLSRLPRWLDW